jgi:F-type H+-transporting ATPase subunit delta
MNPSGKPTHSTEQSPHITPHVHHATVMDVGEQRAARVYAESLLNAAGDKAGEVVDDLEALLSVSQADPRLFAFFSSAALSRELKAKSLRKALTGRASPILLNFVLVLNDHDRLELFRGIAKEARELFDRRAGRMQVSVRSAVVLPDDQRERLLQELRGMFQREPVLEAQVDPELLGGMVVRVGDWVMDDSVRTRLQSLRKQLIEKSSHEIQTGRNRFSAD